MIIESILNLCIEIRLSDFFSTYLGKQAGNRHIETIADLADWLLEKHLVATVPGTAFGDSKCIRFSFAASDQDIKTGLKRLAAGLAELE